jgi:hypothetical protein
MSEWRNLAGFGQSFIQSCLARKKRSTFCGALELATQDLGSVQDFYTGSVPARHGVVLLKAFQQFRDIYCAKVSDERDNTVRWPG